MFIYIVGEDELYEGQKVQGVFDNLKDAKKFAGVHAKSSGYYTYVWRFRPGARTTDSWGLIGKREAIYTARGRY